MGRLAGAKSGREVHRGLECGPARSAAVLVPLLMLLLTACVPTVQRVWSVQPVAGQVHAAETGMPIAGALIRHRDHPDLQAVSDAQGMFQIPAVSERKLQMLMAGSHLRHEIWLVSHPDYAPAMGLTSHIAPSLAEQASVLVVPMFTDLPDAAPTCPFGPYLLALANRYPADGGDVADTHEYDYHSLLKATPCGDDGIRRELETTAQRLRLPAANLQ